MTMSIASPSAIEALTEYVHSSYQPEVNRSLRSEKRDERIELLEMLYTKNHADGVFYRGLSNSSVKIEDGVLLDKGFLSTSESLDTAMSFAPYQDAAIFIINVPEGATVIDVNQIIDCNNEQEIILPHHSTLELQKTVVYSDLPGDSNLSISEFEQEHSGELYEKLLDYERLTVYYFTVRHL